MSNAPLEHSVVVPVFNEEANVRELAERLVPVLERAGSFEILFVDDGSRDETATVVRLLHEQDRRIKLIRFTRNYGQEAAVQAGILRSSGRWVVQMDGDLQNPPEELHKLLEKRDEGYEIVYGVRKKRKDPLLRILASRLMQWVMAHVLGIELPEDVTTYRVIDGSTARLIASLPEKKKFFSALAVWTGARSISVAVGHAPRMHGKTKYNLAKLINHTFDLMVGFSTRPLRLIGQFGGIVALGGLAFGLLRIVQKLLGVDIAMGYTSLFSAIVILGGLQLIALSVIGEYIARIFIQTQGRPLYNIAEEVGWTQAAVPRTERQGTDD
jgi:dolichol-phosphate mannosyltransferase